MKLITNKRKDKRKFGKPDSHQQKHSTKNKMGTNKRSSENIIIITIVAICVISILYLWPPIFSQLTENGDDKDSIINNPANYVIIPKSSLADGEIHYYETSNVRYYAHKNTWNQIRTRISLCERCSSTSFRVEDNGKTIGCYACKIEWDADTYLNKNVSPSDNIGCGCEDDPPRYLPHIFVDDYVVIEKADIVDYSKP